MRPRSLSSPLPLALAAGAAAGLLGAAPAVATEGPAAPPPAPLLPGLMPPPGPTFPTGRDMPVIRRVRVVPRHVRRGRRARLVVALRTPSRLVVTLSRRTGGHRVRVALRRLPVSGKRLVLRLPRHVDGHRLHPGRYRVRVVAIDAAGNRSQPVDAMLVVRR